MKEQADTPTNEETNVPNARPALLNIPREERMEMD